MRRWSRELLRSPPKEIEKREVEMMNAFQCIRASEEEEDGMTIVDVASLARMENDTGYRVKVPRNFRFSLLCHHRYYMSYIIFICLWLLGIHDNSSGSGRVGHEARSDVEKLEATMARSHRHQPLLLSEWRPRLTLGQQAAHGCVRACIQGECIRDTPCSMVTNRPSGRSARCSFRMRLLHWSV